MVAFFHLPLNIARTPLFSMCFKRVNVILWKINDMKHNWHIGQDIVCIKTHSTGLVKEGDVFTIKGLREGYCKCSKVQINIGFTSIIKKEQCRVCSVTRNCEDNFHWLTENLFAPLDTLTDISEIEEILSQPIESLFKV